jgi:hypothetical protein
MPPLWREQLLIFYLSFAFSEDFRAPSIPRFSAEGIEGSQWNLGLHNFQIPQISRQARSRPIPDIACY